MKQINKFNLLIAGFLLFNLQACNTLMPRLNVQPSLIPSTATFVPLISQQVVLASQLYNESHTNPAFTITSQTPQLSGSNDPRVRAFNQRLNEISQKEIKSFSDEFMLYSATPILGGNSLHVTYMLTAQYNDVWSFKLNFLYYYDNPTQPGFYNIPINYDLAQGKELSLGDLFLPNSNYLEVISKYCIAELGKRNIDPGLSYGGTYPTPYNYDNWNITPDGIMITFNQSEVAPYEVGPQYVIVPYSEIAPLINPKDPLMIFVH